MSGQGFPFQADAFAYARWDYCRTPEGVPDISDQLTCSLKARQCGSHIAATQDRRWRQLAAGPLGSLLGVAKVNGWDGTESCVDVDASGVCSLMGSDRYGPAFWEASGRRRAEDANAAILQARSGKVPVPPELENRAQLRPAVFGSITWLKQHY